MKYVAKLDENVISSAPPLTSPQSESPKFPNLWAKYAMKYPMARRYETFTSLLLVQTEKVCGILSPLKG
jgi:hypothetical protein